MQKIHNDFQSGTFSGSRVNSVNPSSINERSFISNQVIDDQAVVLVELRGLRPHSKEYKEAHANYVEELKKYKYDPLAFEANFTRMRRKILFND